MRTVREMQHDDIDRITEYWLSADTAFLEGMGVDIRKMPTREQWQQMLGTQLSQTYPEKQSYCMIWELDGQPVGHSNVNKIRFGEEAFVHLHLWRPDKRQQGIGASFVLLSLPVFFENLQLKKIYCEPYAHNPAPNKTLEKIGFQFIKTLITTPGWLNFEQPVNLWVFHREQLSPDQ